MSITKLHEAARVFAASGIPVFPCVTGGKEPATRRGFKDATTDLEQIDRWWSEAEYNVAFCPADAGFFVIDLDNKPNIDGAAAWERLQAEHGRTPETYTVRTPRGGRHVYFRGTGPSSASKLSAGIDTRGSGGYVLVPPSTVGGVSYEVENDCDAAPLPAWVSVLVTKERDHATAAESRLDLPANLWRAKVHLASLVTRGDVAVEGRGGNERTYELACELRNLGLSPGAVLDLLETDWNPHCRPPWSQDELAEIVGNAARYAQNEAGAWAVAPAAEVFAGVLDLLPALPEQPARRSRFHFEDEAEQEIGIDVPFLIDRLIPDATTILLVGAKGSFKSFVAQELLLAIAAGVPTFGVAPSRSGPTFFGAHEGRVEMKRARRRAWRLGRGIDPSTKIPFFIAPAPRIISENECEEFREEIRVRLRQSSVKIGAIALDTVAKCMAGMDENSALDAGRFVAFCDSLVTEFECPVIALHHTGKNGLKTSRGSGALEAGFGTVIDVERAGKSKALAVSVRYHKDAEEPEKPWTFEGHVVGPSLVFSPISGAEFKAQTMEDDPFDRLKIGAILKKLGAVGKDQGITTQVLAAELAPALPNDTDEIHADAVAKARRVLATLSRKSLSAYCTREGRELIWWLPDAEA